MGKLKYQYLYKLTALLSVGFLGACNEPTTFVPTNTEQFVYDNRDYYQQASKLLQADYLIVPDFSYSMTTSKADVEDALEEFADYLDSTNVDYKVGFARGSTQSAGFYEGAIPSTFMGSVLSKTSSASAQSLVAEKLSLLAGPNAPNLVLILETAAKVIQSQASSFLRESAQLVYVFISDSDDAGNTVLNSNRTTSYYVDQLSGAKSHIDYISARALVTQGTNTCPLAGNPAYGYKAGTRLKSVASSLDASADSFLCLGQSDDLADSLKDLARDVSKPTRRFKVQADADPSSIQVRVNGSLVNPGASTWTFKANTNEVVFKNSAKPAESATVEITFDMIMTLERQPNLSSTVVTLNGQQVPQSNSSGWSINTNNLQIEFHGSWIPNSGDIILVSYEVQ